MRHDPMRQADIELTKQGYRRQIEPDWASIYRELKRKYVTLSILWDEYVPTAYTGSSVA